jgi:membrane protein DedA with SNARE-associated domain
MELFIHYLHNLPDCLIYLFLGLSAFVENLIPPFPGDTIMGLFLAGMYLGRRFFLKRDYRFFKKSQILKAEHWFGKYGYFLILTNRFLPGIRSVISIAAGISELKISKVLCLSLISAAIWNFIWIFMGYILGNNWDMVESKISAIFMRYNLAIFSLFIALVLVLIIRKKLGRKK